MTFFGLTLEFPRGAKTVEVWNRGTGTLLATREVDQSVPEVHLDDPATKDHSLSHCAGRLGMTKDRS